MELGLVAFMTAHGCLLEVGDPKGTTRLIDEFAVRFGAPDFSKEGDTTIGYHLPTQNPTERYLFVGLSANEEAARSAIRLLTLRHGLARLHRIGRPRGEPEEDWQPDPTQQPSKVTVWPTTDRLVKDAIVIEHAERRGLFVHRASTNKAVGWRATPKVKNALTFESEQAAMAFLEQHEGDWPFVLSYKSAALARADQDAASFKRSEAD